MDFMFKCLFQAENGYLASLFGIFFRSFVLSNRRRISTIKFIQKYNVYLQPEIEIQIVSENWKMEIEKLDFVELFVQNFLNY